MPTFAKAVSSPRLAATEQAGKDLAEHVAAALAEPALRFELQDQTADTTFRFATSSEAVTVAERRGATRFQYLDRAGLPTQVDKVDGAWIVRDSSSRETDVSRPTGPRDRSLASVQESLDREAFRAIETRAEQRSEPGLVVDPSVDRDLAIVDRRALQRIEDVVWREGAGHDMAKTARGFPAYAAALGQDTREAVFELKAQYDRKVELKEARKANDAELIQDDARQRAAAWSPEEAARRARSDVAEFRREQDETERHYKLDDLALRSEANPRYRQSLTQYAADVASEVDARIGLQKHEEAAPASTSPIELAHALAKAEQAASARPAGTMGAKEGVELVRGDLWILDRVGLADGKTRTMALSAIGRIAARHAEYAAALQDADPAVADLARRQFEESRNEHGTRLPPTLTLVSQGGTRLSVARRPSGELGWLLERPEMQGQPNSFFGSHATDGMPWIFLDGSALTPLEGAAIAKIEELHDFDAEARDHVPASVWQTSTYVRSDTGGDVIAAAVLLPDGAIGVALSGSHFDGRTSSVHQSLAALEQEMDATDLDGNARSEVRALAALYEVPHYDPYSGFERDGQPAPSTEWQVIESRPESLMRANFDARAVEVLHEGAIVPLHGRADIDAWSADHQISGEDRQRLVDLDVAAARGADRLDSPKSSPPEKEHSMSTPTASKQDQVQQDPIERIGARMDKQDWQEAINVIKARDGKGSLYLPKAGGEYGGSLFMVTETHLLQKIARGTLIAHDLNAIENGRAIGSDFDAGKLRLGQPMRIEYGEKIGQAEFLTIGQARRLEVRKEMMEWAEKALPNPKARAAFQRHVDAFTKEAADLPDRPQRNQAPQPRAQNLERGR